MAAKGGSTAPGSAQPLVLCIMGPTGSGKSALAQALAARIPAEIVSVDSALIYRGMDIGTDKPSAAVRARIRHHLIDVRDPAERYSAGAFAADAARAVAGIVARGRLPLLVGGTFLYFRSLIAGFSPMPAANHELRAEIRARARAQGWAALHAELARVDPAAAARIAPADAQRLERATELFHLTGKAPTQLHATAGVAAPWRVRKFALFPESRPALAQRLELRFQGMLERGLVDEVRRLHRRGDLDASCPSVRAVGYRQLWQFLDGECDLEEATRRAVVATRRYAKRQMTWLRSEPGIERIACGDRALDRVLARLSAKPPNRALTETRVLP